MSLTVLHQFFFPPPQAGSKTRSSFSVSFHVVMYSVQVSVVADITIRQTTILMSLNPPRPFPLQPPHLSTIVTYLFYSCPVSQDTEINIHHLPGCPHTVAIHLGPPQKNIHSLLIDKQ